MPRRRAAPLGMLAPPRAASARSTPLKCSRAPGYSAQVGSPAVALPGGGGGGGGNPAAWACARAGWAEELTGFGAGLAHDLLRNYWVEVGAAAAAVHRGGGFQRDAAGFAAAAATVS